MLTTCWRMILQVEERNRAVEWQFLGYFCANSCVCFLKACAIYLAITASQITLLLVSRHASIHTYREDIAPARRRRRRLPGPASDGRAQPMPTPVASAGGWADDGLLSAFVRDWAALGEW